MIYLMRHGADPSDRYGGWSTYGLTEKGKEQVHGAKSSLCNKGITQIFSSDIKALENQIETKIDGLQNKNSIQEIKEYKKDINSYITKKAK